MKTQKGKLNVSMGTSMVQRKRWAGRIISVFDFSILLEGLDGGGTHLESRRSSKKSAHSTTG